MSIRIRTATGRYWTAAGWSALALLFSWWVWTGLTHIRPFIATWDEVDFVLALERFDLLAMQPHFPGYPFFVLGGLLVHLAGGIEQEAAYGVFNVLLSASAAVPIGLLAGRRTSPLAGGLIALVILTAPYVWIQSLRPMSEAAGIAVLWWFLWCWYRAMERKTWGSAVGALALFGLLMGIRLSFAPFGIALLWLAIILVGAWHGEGRRVLPRLALFIGWGGLFQLVWIAGLVLAEGSIASFAKLAGAFIAGHFGEWGGGVAAAPLPPGERLLRFAGSNVLWTGWFARSTPLMLAAAALLLAAMLRLGARSPGAAAPGAAAAQPTAHPSPAGGSARRRQQAAAALRTPPLLTALAVLGAVYAVWAYVGQNIDKARHITPLIGILWLLVLALALGRLRGTALRGEVLAKRAGLCFACIVLAVQAMHGVELAARQASETPAVYQLANEVDRLAAEGRIAVYTWEETRVLGYLGAASVHQRIQTYALFRSETRSLSGTRIFLTDKVLAGFEAQAGDLSGQVRLAGEWVGDPLFDPVYGTIRLYEWLPEAQ
jgi:hypothetical protein